MPLFRRTVILMCLSIVPATASGQSIGTDERRMPPVERRHTEPLFDQALRLSKPMAPALLSHRRAGRDQAPSNQGKRTLRQRILGAAVGAAGGFFAGGYTGAWIEGDGCHCDDPGLKGALIGAPIGAVAGGILGGLYLF